MLLPTLVHGPKIDAARVHINTIHLDTHALAETVGTPRALTDQALGPGIMVIVVIGQARDVHETVNLQFRYLDEHSEIGHPGDDARVFLTKFPLHVLALQPRLHFARRILGASFVR